MLLSSRGVARGAHWKLFKPPPPIRSYWNHFDLYKSIADGNLLRRSTAVQEGRLCYAEGPRHTFLLHLRGQVFWRGKKNKQKFSPKSRVSRPWTTIFFRPPPPKKVFISPPCVGGTKLLMSCAQIFFPPTRDCMFSDKKCVFFGGGGNFACICCSILFSCSRSEPR